MFIYLRSKLKKKRCKSSFQNADTLCSCVREFVLSKHKEINNKKKNAPSTKKKKWNSTALERKRVSTTLLVNSCVYWGFKKKKVKVFLQLFRTPKKAKRKPSLGKRAKKKKR